MEGLDSKATKKDGESPAMMLGAPQLGYHRSRLRHRFGLIWSRPDLELIA
jgi:hypothetical protein